MDKNKNTLNEPAVNYGRKVHVSELQFKPMDNMMETLRFQGYVSLDEFISKVSKFM